MNKIILISGVAGTGKTTLAKKLALSLGIDKIYSIDIISAVCKMFVSKEQEPYLHTTTHSAKEVEGLSTIDAFKKHCLCIQSYLFKLIEGNNKDAVIIIEGSQITKEFVDILKKTHFVLNLHLQCSKSTLTKHYQNKLKLRKSNWLEHMEEILLIQDYLKKDFPNDIITISDKADNYQEIETKVKSFMEIKA